MDWYDVTKPGRMRALLIEPNRVNSVIGELFGVEWKECSIEAFYNTDTRTQAKLVVHDGNWDGRAWIRLVYESDDYEIVLGTYIVTNDPMYLKYNHRVYKLNLQSVLWGLSREKSECPWIIGKGVYCSTVLKQLFEWCKASYSLTGLKEYYSTSSATLERGQSVLDWLFAIADYTGNRVDVTGYGVVTFKERVTPANIPQAWYLDTQDPRGLIVDGIHRESDWTNTPGRVIVHHQVGSGKDAKDIVARVDASGRASFANRGYLSTLYKSVPDMSPETQQQAYNLAKNYLLQEGKALTEWSFDCVGLPVWEGTGVTLLPHDVVFTGARQCFVKSVQFTSLHLNRPTMHLTLKECSSDDKEAA